MPSLEQYIDKQLTHGRAYFNRAEAEAAVDLGSSALSAAITRLIKKRKLANPRHGFYLILRPEDQVSGASDPARWIDPLMKYQGIDYRISLLRAASFHGSTHQAAMVFQLIAPKQLRDITIGRHQLQFVYQTANSFALANQPENLQLMKTDAGYAQIAGAELTLLDCARYFHKAAGINGVAQIAKDIGDKADPDTLARIAQGYENAAVRRLGYLLEIAGHAKQAAALEPLARQAKTAVPIDPSYQPLFELTEEPPDRNSKWKLIIHENVEIDF